MINTPLVSIIIPTYNRAHLINETLDSVLAQTYSNWECIIVDDGSTDDTKNIVNKYVEKDNRFQFHKRPKNRPKGANACRNYGFELSKGEYINWFDSDDLMISNKIEMKLAALLHSEADYVISKTFDFNHPTINITFISTPTNYNFNNFNINHFNYVSQQLNWLTPDVMIRSELVKKVKFNERLLRGQEYNFYVKLTLYSEKGFFLDEFLTKRRLHTNSIKNQFTKVEVDRQSINLRMITLTEIYTHTSTQVKRWFIANIAKNITRVNMRLSFKEEEILFKDLYLFFGFRCLCYFICSRVSKFIFNRNEFFRRLLKKCLV